MPIFVIGGRSDCVNFTHAVYAAEYLNKKLPNFQYRVEKHDEMDFKVWLDKTNNEHGWYVTTSPLIWKEITRTGGTAYLIGGLSEFWEYCCDYYGFESLLPKTELLKLIEDNLALSGGWVKNPKIVSVTGACTVMLHFLISQLEDFEGSDEVVFRLYDKNWDDPDVAEDLLHIYKQLKYIIRGNPNKIVLMTGLQETITDCDLLLVLDDFSRQSEETEEEWLERCYLEMSFLAFEINSYAKRHLKVILGHDGPACFNATVLVRLCTSLRLANIVAVTADEGIAMMSAIAEKFDVPLSNLGCAPVWGFPQVKVFVDLRSSLLAADVFRPYAVAPRMKASVLPKGVVCKELRTLSTVLNEDEAEEIRAHVKARRKKQAELLGKPPMLAKVRALVTLLKVWFSSGTLDEKDSILSLGVCSDGSFGFPTGIVFSQAAMLNKSKIWRPLSKFPISEAATKEIPQIVSAVTNILEPFFRESSIDYNDDTIVRI